MLPVRLPAFSRLMTVLVVIIAVLLLVDVAVAVQLAVRHSFAPVANLSQSSATSSTHPCNHGFYVSQAAHAKKGGGYVSGIAQSNLGKDGKCTTPLPSAAPAAGSK